MGTRSLTRVFDDEDEVVCMYRQFDGYLSGHGKDLAKFLAPLRETNGLVEGPTFNGMACLAAQIVAHFKTAPGGFYLYKPGIPDAGQEYEYHVHASGVDPGIGKPSKPAVITVLEGYGEEFKVLHKRKTPKQLLAIIAKEEKAEKAK
jgi:hypothetical protein